MGSSSKGRNPEKSGGRFGKAKHIPRGYRAKRLKGPNQKGGLTWV